MSSLLMLPSASIPHCSTDVDSILGQEKVSSFTYNVAAFTDHSKSVWKFIRVMINTFIIY